MVLFCVIFSPVVQADLNAEDLEELGIPTPEQPDFLRQLQLLAANEDLSTAVAGDRTTVGPSTAVVTPAALQVGHQQRPPPVAELHQHQHQQKPQLAAAARPLPVGLPAIGSQVEVLFMHGPRRGEVRGHDPKSGGFTVFFQEGEGLWPIHPAQHEFRQLPLLHHGNSSSHGGGTSGGDGGDGGASAGTASVGAGGEHSDGGAPAAVIEESTKKQVATILLSSDSSDSEEDRKNNRTAAAMAATNTDQSNHSQVDYDGLIGDDSSSDRLWCVY